MESTTSEKEKVIGGIEVAIKFPNPSARKQVINMGYGSGWRTIAPIFADDEAWLPIVDAEQTNPCNIQFSIDTLSIPVNVINKELGDEQSLFQRIYAKYKFYDQGIEQDFFCQCYYKEQGFAFTLWYENRE